MSLSKFNPSNGWITSAIFSFSGFNYFFYLNNVEYNDITDVVYKINGEIDICLANPTNMIVSIEDNSIPVGIINSNNNSYNFYISPA